MDWTAGPAGVMAVAYGAKAREEAEGMIESLRRWHDWPVVVLGDGTVRGASVVRDVGNAGWGARWAKLRVDQWAPWPAFLYLDADTRVQAPLSVGFEVLADGWDLVITASEHQETDWLWHVSDREREDTEAKVGRMLQLQGGVFWAARNERTGLLFAAWRHEWRQYEREDQAALLRAVRRAPVRLWLVGREFNGGSVVEHRWGRARA